MKTKRLKNTIWMAVCALPSLSLAQDASDFSASKQFAEATCIVQIEPEVRIHVNRPNGRRSDSTSATRLIIYATPNGNTIEQTLGRAMEPSMDWHFDIQHVAAQTRLLRSIVPHERIILVCAEPKGLSWPAWRARTHNPNPKIVAMIDAWRIRYGGTNATVTLTGHSGGGSFLWGAIEGAAKIPAYIDRIAMLDANYSYDRHRHKKKILDWLQADSSRRLFVIAYDDRNIELDGKKVVGPTGGTHRATHRMLDDLREPLEIVHDSQMPFDVYRSETGQLAFFVHTNPDNKILHTALVGEMNGLVQAQTWGSSNVPAWGTLGGPRAYQAYVEGPAVSNVTDPQLLKGVPLIPPRPAGAKTGIEFMRSIDKLALPDREQAIEHEITSGNIPDFLRAFITVPVSYRNVDGDWIHGTLDVMPDYLSVGDDLDFVRVPMTPQSAQSIADHFGCVLPTRKMVDAIDAVAHVRRSPIPLTEDREAVSTFIRHHQLIESAGGSIRRGQLITGIKKDIVVTPRLVERPHRLALYGWRNTDGSVIQELTTVHTDTYVDYSHGVRLVRDVITVGGESKSVQNIWRDNERCELLSDEGTLLGGYYSKH